MKRERNGWVSSLIVLGVNVALCLLAVPVNGQSYWTATRRGLPGKDLNAVFFADSKRGWIGGDDGFISRTEDGGITWTKQSVFTTDAVNDIYFRNKDEGFAVAGGMIFSTESGGETWTQKRAFTRDEFGGNQPELYTIRFTNKKRGWVVGSLSRKAKNGDVVVTDSLIYRTTDAGETWQRQKPPTQQELIHLDFVNAKSGWVVGSGGTILYTNDGGETWLSQVSHTDSTIYHVDFRNDKKGWAVGDGGKILRTVDGGDSWTVTSVGPRLTLLTVQFVNEDDGWIAGRGGSILYTSDGGATWLRQQADTEKNIYALFFDKKGGWAVGGDGIVLHYER